MKSKLNLLIREVTDNHAQENFQKIESFYAEYLFKNFKVIQLDVTSILETTLNHNLGFKPEDVILTYNNADGYVIFKHEKFTDKTYTFECAKPCKIKFLIGKF